jgi:hypothetical protein
MRVHRLDAKAERVQAFAQVRWQLELHDVARPRRCWQGKRCGTHEEPHLEGGYRLGEAQLDRRGRRGERGAVGRDRGDQPGVPGRPVRPEGGEHDQGSSEKALQIFPK